jgi:hypothetical protein
MSNIAAKKASRKGFWKAGLRLRKEAASTKK